MDNSAAAKAAPASMLTPAMRADAAAKHVLGLQLALLESSQADLLRNGGIEALHDLRVAVRRTRSALGQIKQVFPAPRAQRFAAGFASLSRTSCAARDWEVCLQSLAVQEQSLPEPLRSSLDPLRVLLKQKHQQELRCLKSQLRSKSHQRFLADWRAFLNAPVPRRSTLAQASQPLHVVAGRRIWKIYRRVVREGEAIKSDSPPQALHELRKTCKKLRYLLEFFGDIYPPRQHRRLVNILKALQEELGLYQDCQVQAAILLKLAEERRLRRAPTATSLAMGALLLNSEQTANQARARFDRRFALLASAKTRRRLSALLHADSEEAGD